MRPSYRIPKTPAEAERFLWHALGHAPDIDLGAQEILDRAIEELQYEQGAN